MLQSMIKRYHTLDYGIKLFPFLICIMIVSVSIAAAPKQISHNRQLFVDDEMVSSTHGITFTLHQPNKHVVDGAVVPVLVRDRPWEEKSVAPILMVSQLAPPSKLRVRKLPVCQPAA